MRTVKYLFLSLALPLALTSCNTKGTVVRANELSGEDFIDPNIELAAKPLQSQTTTTSKPQKNIKAQKQSSKSQSKTKTDKKKQLTPKPAANHNLSAEASALSGEWIIVRVDDTPIIQDEDMPYIIFSDKDSRFYASDGCNTINGDYKVNTDHTISFTKSLQTLKACPHIDYPGTINQVLSGSKPITTKYEKINNETYLTLIYNGKETLQLRRHNLENFSGEWEVTDIGGEKVDGDEVNVFLDIPELSIHGNTGCNYFNGIIVIDPNIPSSISFAQMGVTRKMCPNADIERLMLVALEEVATYELNGSNTLLLKDADGNTVITLHRN